VAARATVIHHPIGSVYPPVNGLCDLVFRMLTCTMKPLRFAGKLTSETLYILWTTTLATETGNQLWSPNHFVPLLRVHSDSPIVSPLEDDEVEAS